MMLQELRSLLFLPASSWHPVNNTSHEGKPLCCLFLCCPTTNDRRSHHVLCYIRYYKEEMTKKSKWQQFTAYLVLPLVFCKCLVDSNAHCLMDWGEGKERHNKNKLMDKHYGIVAHPPGEHQEKHWMGWSHISHGDHISKANAVSHAEGKGQIWCTCLLQSLPWLSIW